VHIGELAKRSDCAVETIRYYEREHLLPEPQRSSGNYRVYRAEHVERLSFIRRCRSLDMSLPEIRSLLEAIEQPEADCAPINALVDEHIGHVAARIGELKQLKSELDAIRAHCSGAHPAKACGILDALAQEVRTAARARAHVDGAHGRQVRRKGPAARKA